jgi:hypothetical protein
VKQRNIKAGELISTRFEHLHGGRTYRILVTYKRTAEPGVFPPMRVGGVTVGRARVPVP